MQTIFKYLYFFDNYYFYLQNVISWISKKKKIWNFEGLVRQLVMGILMRQNMGINIYF